MTKTLGRLAQTCMALALCLAISNALAATCPPSNDFNNDGNSDILWRNNTTAQDYIFFMDRTSVLGSSAYTNTVAAPWQVVGTGDFNGDRNWDILWRNNTTGQDYIFFMSGPTVLGSSTYTNTVAAPWQVVGTGDFDGDGTSDILWRNNTTGQDYIYFMNGATVRTTSGYTNTVDTSWAVAGVGDFDGDGKSDILWRNNTTGQDYIYFMNGATVRTTSGYTNTVDTSWAVAGVGDFDRDGKADILWRNNTTGQNYIFFMNGTTVLGNSAYTNTVAAPWTVVGTGDHNGDGFADILWRNNTTGQNYIFFMNGTTVLGSSGYTNTVLPPWSIVPASALIGSNSCGSVTASINPARTAGVAPLMVFFDATATTGTATSKPFQDIEYRWDFGDPAGSPVNGTTWGTGSRAGVSSRNAATGPVAAHVFETPGTYSVTLTATDGARAATKTVQITVDDPDLVFSTTNTVCVSGTATFTGCPANAAHVTSSDFDQSLSNNIDTNKRVLFHRGETFTASASTNITANGPWSVGAYGTGAKPQVNASGSFGNNGVITVGNNGTASRKDGRIADLSMDGNGSAELIDMGGGFDQLLLLRIDTTNSGDTNIFLNSAILQYNSDTPHLWEQAGIVDCTASAPKTWGIFFNAKNFAFMGNDVRNDTGGSPSHTLRISLALNGVISNNTLGPGTSYSTDAHVLKLHGPCWACVSGTDGVPTNSYTENVEISDNRFIAGTGAGSNWTVAIAPQSSSDNEHLRNIIFERNWITAASYTSYELYIQAVNMTVRNNLFNTSGGGGGTAIYAEQRDSAAPAPTGLEIYNNTMYTSAGNLDSGTPFIGLASNVATGGATIVNNLGYAPAVSSASMIGGSSSDYTASNNTPNVKTSPNFFAASPSSPSDFAIKAGSYAQNGGTTVPVYSDFFGTALTNRTVRDMGFMELP